MFSLFSWVLQQEIAIMTKLIQVITDLRDSKSNLILFKNVIDLYFTAFAKRLVFIVKILLSNQRDEYIFLVSEKRKEKNKTFIAC